MTDGRGKYVYLLSMTYYYTWYYILMDYIVIVIDIDIAIATATSTAATTEDFPSELNQPSSATSQALTISPTSL